jgi:predicted  nucleic acid-binding Zn-ribbon protein
MNLIDGYVDEYLDKNMEYLIEEWQLATKRDITDYRKRVQALEREIDPLADFEASASEKLAALENRLKKIKEGL